ncbi:MAG: DNA translocase FtsK 4TM domain-containing protein [Candidatus Hydrogenedentes bacterium]|nr:DNA translocase FtsK 4TM domain-containing protein [Candidatus Hydrogenedentota bacterium]
MTSERMYEIAGIVVLALTLLVCFALATDGYDAAKHQERNLDHIAEFPNMLQTPGAILAGILALLLGDASHVIYAVTFIWGIMLFSHRPLDRLFTRLLGLFILIAAAAAMLQVDMQQGTSNTQAGGILGAFLADKFLVGNFGLIGANIIVCTLGTIGILLATDFLFIHVAILAQHATVHVLRGSLALADTSYNFYADYRERSEKRGYGRLAKERERLKLAKVQMLETKKELKDATREMERLRQMSLPEVYEEGEPAMPTAKHVNVYGPAEEVYAQEEDYEDDAADVEPDPVVEPPLERMRIRNSAAPKVVEEEDSVPFDVVPDVTAKRNGNGHAHAVALDLEFTAAPEEEVFEAGEGWEGESEDYEARETRDESAAAYDMPATKVVEELNARSPVAPAIPQQQFIPVVDVITAKPVRRLRRRTSLEEMEELPPDYEYPKRYTKPPITMFDEPENQAIPNLEEQLRSTGLLLEETLLTFNIEARVTDVTRGPTITRFELEPAPGIKVSRFLSLADDIALKLRAHRVRVEAPIPGKDRIGIEVPNLTRDQVLIRELLENRVFLKGKGKLNLALGKDIAGDVNIADLATMPHLLVAGATGAGKTVCVKSILASLLYKHTPDELQLILIDPKMVELSIFNDIPHLITPVVTEPKKASVALSWLITEMEERYRLFADLRVRNIEVYNKSVENGEIEVEGDDDHEAQSVHVIRKLPYIVCVIDELADLMMLARAEVEDSIGRLAQLARAVGIHLIIATQRPSVDVLTGVIKANFPARLSFQVSSRVDSRCILDEIGAERLIGMGDMLYLPAGQSKPQRIQGAFVSDDEMFALIAHLKRQAPPQYRDEIENFGQKKDAFDEFGDEGDELFDDAVRTVMETGQASISMVQRRLRVGYTRAARLIDMMEMKGIVGPHTGSKAREILVAAPMKDAD